MSSEASVVAGTRAPISGASLLADLRALGVERGTVVMAHTSLSSIGWVIGGAQAVVGALLEAVGDSGTLVMPSMSSQLSDPSHWSDPPVPQGWFATIRDNMPAYDPALTPTRGLGAVVECFIRHPETLRSPHPLASFAANGARAADITGEHPLTPMVGDASPLGRLYELDARVLLIGVGHERNTSMHLAEHRADWPGKRRYTEGAPVMRNGSRHWIAFEDLSLDDGDFARIGAAFARTGKETVGFVGQAEARLSVQRAVVDFAADWISTHRG